MHLNYLMINCSNNINYYLYPFLQLDPSFVQVKYLALFHTELAQILQIYFIKCTLQVIGIFFE